MGTLNSDSTFGPLQPKPERRGDLKFSIVIPCYNEVNTLEHLIKTVKDSSLNPKEISPRRRQFERRDDGIDSQ